MLKQILFVGAAIMSVPAMAQAMQPTDGAEHAHAPTEQAARPVADKAPTGQAASADQIAAILDKEFGIYDSDANGELSAAEFTAWMTKLRASAPQSPAVDPATWAAQAFKVADADSSASVSKAELLSFLSRGA